MAAASLQLSTPTPKPNRQDRRKQNGLPKENVGVTAFVGGGSNSNSSITTTSKVLASATGTS